MTSATDFPVFDADNHLYETEEALTRHLPSRYKGAIDYVQVRGRTKIVVRGAISEYIPNPTFEVVARPGAQEQYFREGNPEGLSYRELIGDPMRCIPAFREPGPRIELMDELGLDRTLMFPTLASLVEERLRDDPELIHAVIHSLNEWLHEEWSFNYEDRIFTTPIITLPIVEKAIEELEWAVERGARTVLIRPAPVPGFRGSRSFGFEEFDPFWQAVVDADVLVSMHASDSGYARYVSDWTGPQEMLPFRPDPFRMMTMGKRPIEDTMAALDVPRGVHPLPGPAGGVGGERRRLGRALPRPPRRHLPQDAPRVRRGPGRGVQAQRLGEPVPRGRHRGPHRRHRRRQGGVRLRLPPSRGAGRSPQLPRPPAPGLADDDVASIMGANLAEAMRVPVAASRA